MHRGLDWDDLRFFLAVAREGSLSAAARALEVNQSTVYRRIDQLEASLDVRLFDRQARGYDLTATGEEMLTLTLRVEDDVLAVGRAVQGADHQLSGTVRVTTVLEVLERLGPALAVFRERYPRIELEVDTEQRVLSLARREADVAIRPGGKPSEDDVIGRALTPLAMAAYAAPAYLKGRSRPRRMQDLARHDRIGFADARQRGRYASSADHAEATVLFRARDMTAQAIAARAGLGVALLPTFMGDHEPCLKRLFRVETPDDYKLWLLIHADLRQTARVRAFVDFLTESVASEARAWR